MNDHTFDDFERLVREHQRVVYQIAYGVLGNAADAQDITQDVFVRAHAKRANLREPNRFRAWVCTISRRLALNAFRSRAQARKREEAAGHDRPAFVVETAAEDRDFEERLRAEIERLPVKLREVLLLCAIDGLEPVDVARLLGVPPGTVRSRLHLARKALLRSMSA